MFRETSLYSITNRKFNVIILAAGLGTRLRPETDFVPKALVQLGPQRAIDFLIRKYQYIAERMIVSVGYCADLLENYCRGKYQSINLLFSREDVTALRGPGTSLVYALDCASSRLPTLITFCDYLVEDQFPVEFDCLGVCNPGDPESVIDSYKTIAEVQSNTVVDLVRNRDIAAEKENGFTGIALFHNTPLLKSLVYTAASERGELESVDYAFDVVRPYLLKVKTSACRLSRIFEFGTEDTLRRTKEYLNGSHALSR